MWLHAIEKELFEEDLPCQTCFNFLEMSDGNETRILCDERENPMS